MLYTVFKCAVIQKCILSEGIDGCRNEQDGLCCLECIFQIFIHCVRRWSTKWWGYFLSNSALQNLSTHCNTWPSQAVFPWLLCSYNLDVNHLILIVAVVQWWMNAWVFYCILSVRVYSVGRVTGLKSSDCKWKLHMKKRSHSHPKYYHHLLEGNRA